jgi:dihydrodipicolinate synthase/N-acetylneuraminate lyase
MSSTEFRGILVATVTPFTQHETEVDVSKIRALVDQMVSSNVGGLVPCGSTGEFFHMTVAERKLATEAFIDSADGRLPVIAHTGALTTAEAINLSQHAASCGASALMLVPPFYERVSARELEAHYTAVARSVDIPIVLYNIPAASSTEVSPAEVARLGAIPGVRYLKDSSGSAQVLNELFLRHSGAVTSWNGSDSLTLYGFVLGATASVWGAANFVPSECVALFDAVQASNLGLARDLWSGLWPIMDMLEKSPYASVVKAGCRIAGWDMGEPRRPFLPLSSEAYETLRNLMASLSSRMSMESAIANT